MTFKDSINPFKKQINENKDIQELQSRIKDIEKKFKNNNTNIEPCSPKLYLNLTQTIKNNYNFKFSLKNIFTNDSKEIDFNNFPIPILFILLKHDFSSSINKIKDLQYNENNKEKYQIFLIIKEEEVKNVYRLFKK